MLCRTIVTSAAAALAAALALTAHAQQTYRVTGVSGFMQDLDATDGVDYFTDFEGTWSAEFTVPAAAGLTLVSNTQSQGGSRTTYSGPTLNSLVLNRPTGPLVLVSSPIAARVIFWDRATFRNGTDYFDITATVGTSPVTISFSAARETPPTPSKLGYNQLWVRGTPNPNTADADGIPLAPDEFAIALTYLSPTVSIDGRTPEMPGRGRYGGNVTSLFDPANPPVLGSCCAASGSCSVRVSSNCTGADVWTSGATCEPNPCPQPTGACCDALLACTIATNDDCSTAGSNYQGDNTTCTPLPCVPPTANVEVTVVGNGLVTSSSPGILCGQGNTACAFDFLLNDEITLTAAPAAGWTFTGWTSDVCSGTGLCGFIVDTDYLVTATFVCKADFDQTGGVTVDDIFGFLNAWFAGQLSADFDSSGVLEVQDIFSFLNAWFAGCA